MSKWEDEEWNRDYYEVAEKLHIPKPKPKKTLKERMPGWVGWRDYDSDLSVFAKCIITFAIVVPLTLSCVIGGIQLWGWSDKVVWGTFDGRITITTPYAYTHVYNEYFDDLKAGAMIPMQVRRNLIRHPTPWKKINPYNEPKSMRIDLERFWMGLGE